MTPPKLALALLATAVLYFAGQYIARPGRYQVVPLAGGPLALRLDTITGHAALINPVTGTIEPIAKNK